MYNERRRIEMKSPVDGMVKQALVTQSQSVRTGDQLAVISSPEVGTARNEVNQHAAELALDRKEADRAEQIATNLAALLELLKQNPKPRGR